MRRTAWFLVVFAVSAMTIAAAAEDIGWQDAVARLAHERTIAETCAGLLKKYGDDSAKARGELAYTDAKAEYDAVIAGLDVALAKKTEPASLSDLETRLRRGVEKRETFCDSVRPLLPPPSAGQKGPIAEIVSGALGPLIDAVKAIWLRTRDDDALMRKTIETQLEATKWPSFASVSQSL
jgi:hypothetical protein